MTDYEITEDLIGGRTCYRIEPDDGASMLSFAEVLLREHLGELHRSRCELLKERIEPSAVLIPRSILGSRRSDPTDARVLGLPVMWVNSDRWEVV